MATTTALAAQSTLAAPVVRPILRTDWAVKLPDGRWLRAGRPDPVAPTLHSTRAAAVASTVELIEVASSIAALDYRPHLYVRVVVIDGRGVHVGAWQLADPAPAISAIAAITGTRR